ncbi:putative kinase domain protein, partial [Trichinella spiralis]
MAGNSCGNQYFSYKRIASNILQRKKAKH